MGVLYTSGFGFESRCSDCGRVERNNQFQSHKLEIAGSTPVPATNILRRNKNESKNVQTNFIETAADQPKLVWLEWVKIWILSGTFYVRDDPCGRYPDIRSRDFSWAYSVSGQHDGLQNRKREFESYYACIGV